MPLPVLMASSSNTWYYLTAANFYDNHVRPGLDASDDEDKLVESVKKAVRGRQGAAGAATTKNTTIFKTSRSREAVKVLIKKEVEAAVATNPTFDVEGKCSTHFNTTGTFRIVTVTIDPAASSTSPVRSEVVERRFQFMIAKYGDGKCRMMHYGGLAPA